MDIDHLHKLVVAVREEGEATNTSGPAHEDLVAYLEATLPARITVPTALGVKAETLCPFCEGFAELHRELRGGHVPDEPEAYAYFYICDSCACTGGWGKSEASALHMWRMRATGKFCRGEGCPRADLCRRHMDAAKVDHPTYFDKSPIQIDGQCGEFASNGWLRGSPVQCGGAHPPPRCAWNCEIELHRWEKQGDEWIWTGGVEH